MLLDLHTFGFKYYIYFCYLGISFYDSFAYLFECIYLIFKDTQSCSSWIACFHFTDRGDSAEMFIQFDLAGIIKSIVLFFSKTAKLFKHVSFCIFLFNWHETCYTASLDCPPQTILPDFWNIKIEPTVHKNVLLRAVL